jgi:hypothetical protein
MEYRIQHVTFTKAVADGDDIVHHARIITYIDLSKARPKPVSLLTNDMEMDCTSPKRFTISWLRTNFSTALSRMFPRRDMFPLARQCQYFHTVLGADDGVFPLG